MMLMTKNMKSRRVLFRILFFVALFVNKVGCFFLECQRCDAVKLNGATADPFRSEKESIDPVTINILRRVLFQDEKVDFAMHALLDSRKDSISATDKALIYERVQGVSVHIDELKSMLLNAVDRNKFITKYGMESDYGVSGDIDSNPLTQLCYTECLLALFMLHKERINAIPQFIDNEKLKVLMENS